MPENKIIEHLFFTSWKVNGGGGRGNIVGHACVLACLLAYFLARRYSPITLALVVVFLVYWFIGLLICWFVGSLVRWFVGVLVFGGRTA